MASLEPTPLANYHHQVSRLDQQHGTLQKIKPTDYFKFHFNVVLGSRPRSNMIVNLTTLIHFEQHVGCKRFFQDGQDFLRSCICHPLFTIEQLDQITERVTSEVQQMFELDESLASDPDPDHDHAVRESVGSHHVFPLLLEILLDVPDNGEDTVMEVSMQEVRMIPASKKAIDELLKKAKLTEGTERTEQCSICTEEFDVGSDDVSAMPCNHVFHQQCIVQWLQTSHLCPLCRYPLPTASD